MVERAEEGGGVAQREGLGVTGGAGFQEEAEVVLANADLDGGKSGLIRNGTFTLLHWQESVDQG